jgi:hypothetical protein
VLWAAAKPAHNIAVAQVNANVLINDSSSVSIVSTNGSSGKPGKLKIAVDGNSVQWKVNRKSQMY